MNTDTATRYNVELLQQVRDVIADENNHDQSLWMRISRSVLNSIPARWVDSNGNKFIEVSCPTAACVAGWAASLSGAKMVVHEHELGWQWGHVQAQDVIFEGETHGIARFARDRLGLTDREADALFAAEWTNEDVLDNLDDILQAARHGVDWDIRWVEDDDDYDNGDDY